MANQENAAAERSGAAGGSPPDVRLVGVRKTYGDVVAVASGDLRVGDQVYGVTNPQFTGAYAEYALASAAMVSSISDA